MKHSRQSVNQSSAIHRQDVAKIPGDSLGLKVNIANDYVASTAATLIRISLKTVLTFYCFELLSC